MSAQSRSGSVLRLATIYSIAAALLAFVLPPIVIPFLTSFKTPRDVYALPPKLLPTPFTLDSYFNAIMEKGFHVNLMNSLIVATAVTFITLVIALPPAYGLARFRFPGRRAVAMVVLLGYLVPGISLLVPLFVTFRSFGLIDTLYGLVISHLILTVPFAVWFLRGYFIYVPWELEEAAMIDGCSRFRALLLIIVPIIAPAIMAVGFFSFVTSWAEFVFALVFAGMRTATAPLALAGFVQESYVDWGGLAAASMMFAVPVAILFLYFQRFLVSGLAGGSVKG
jgi:ABC-type glycerol-3-phosphate transport system permease component